VQGRRNQRSRALGLAQDLGSGIVFISMSENDNCLRAHFWPEGQKHLETRWRSTLLAIALLMELNAHFLYKRGNISTGRNRIK
jgi:hypothetical protein